MKQFNTYKRLKSDIKGLINHLDNQKFSCSQLWISARLKEMIRDKEQI